MCDPNTPRPCETKLVYLIIFKLNERNRMGVAKSVEYDVPNPELGEEDANVGIEFKVVQLDGVDLAKTFPEVYDSTLVDSLEFAREII